MNSKDGSKTLIDIVNKQMMKIMEQITNCYANLNQLKKQKGEKIQDLNEISKNQKKYQKTYKKIQQSNNINQTVESVIEMQPDKVKETEKNQENQTENVCQIQVKTENCEKNQIETKIEQKSQFSVIVEQFLENIKTEYQKTEQELLSLLIK